MRGNNFFEPYIEKGNFDFKGKKIITLSVVAVVLVIVLFPIVNKIRIFTMNREIVKIDKEINSKENRVRKAEVDDTREEVFLLKQKSEILEVIAQDFYKRDNVGDFLVDSITHSMTGAMFLKKIEISGEQAKVTGISNAKESIAILERNLRRVTYFEDIFIPTIKLEEGFYEFEVDIAINNEAVNLKKQEQLDEVKGAIDASPPEEVGIENSGGETKVEAE